MSCGVVTITAPDRLSRWLMLICASPARRGGQRSARRAESGRKRELAAATGAAASAASQHLGRQPVGQDEHPAARCTCAGRHVDEQHVQRRPRHALDERV